MKTTVLPKNIIRELYYDHDERKITDNTGKEYSYEESRKLMVLMGSLHPDSLPISFNIAYGTLCDFKGDMEAVDKFYRENP